MALAVIVIPVVVRTTEDMLTLVPDTLREAAASIANEFTEAVGDLYTSSLIALGLILFVITFIVLAIARYLLLRIERRIG